MRSSWVGVGVVVCSALGLAAPASSISPSGIRVVRDVEYGRTGGRSLLLDAYLPPRRTQPRAAVVLIHGGGWNAADKRDLARAGSKLARLGYVSLSVNYRLQLRSRFPAAMTDVFAAVSWIRRHATRFSLDPTRIGVFGP